MKALRDFALIVVLVLLVLAILTCPGAPDHQAQVDLAEAELDARVRDAAMETYYRHMALYPPEPLGWKPRWE